MKVKLDAEGEPSEYMLTASEASRYNLPTPPRGKGKPGGTATLRFDKRGQSVKRVPKPSKEEARETLRALAGPAKNSPRALAQRVEDAKRAISPEPTDDPLLLYKIEQAKRAIGRA